MKEFPINQLLSKNDSVELLKSIGTEEYNLPDFIYKIFYNFGWDSFLNASIPLFGGHIEIDKYFKENPKAKNALVIRTNRGVSTAMVALNAEKVTTIDTVFSERSEQIFSLFDLKNIERVILKDREELINFNVSEYDFIYVETGMEDYQTPIGYNKIGRGIFVKAEIKQEISEQVSEPVEAIEQIEQAIEMPKAKKKRATRKKKADENA